MCEYVSMCVSFLCVCHICVFMYITLCMWCVICGLLVVLVYRTARAEQLRTNLFYSVVLLAYAATCKG